MRSLADVSWSLFARGANRLSMRMVDSTFNEIMWTGCSIIHRVKNSNDLALTFDDGPHPKTTIKILNILERYGARATFFCVGQNAKRYPTLVRELVDRGHDIGSHSMSHPDMHRLSRKTLRTEVLDCHHVLEDLIGRRVRYFRAPYGHFRWDLRRASELGIDYLVHWDVAPPWDETEPSKIEAWVTRNAAPGSIVVLHDYLFDQSMEMIEASVNAVAGALPGIVLATTARGARLQTLADMLP